MALQLVLVARIGFRATSRVLRLLAPALGLTKGPCAQTVINWVTRLAIVRLGTASARQGGHLSQAPFSNGLIWMIDISIGLGSGKILAVLALDAHHHQLASGAPSLHWTRCIGVAGAPSWTGETIAEVLKRLIAVMGRPAASISKMAGESCEKPSTSSKRKVSTVRASTTSPTPLPPCSNGSIKIIPTSTPS
jgi:hypothetical protein